MQHDSCNSAVFFCVRQHKPYTSAADADSSTGSFMLLHMEHEDTVCTTDLQWPQVKRSDRLRRGLHEHPQPVAARCKSLSVRTRAHSYTTAAGDQQWPSTALPHMHDWPYLAPTPLVSQLRDSTLTSTHTQPSAAAPRIHSFQHVGTQTNGQCGMAQQNKCRAKTQALLLILTLVLYT
jgi:hypothetical protein